MSDQGTISISSIAGEAYGWFERRERDSGENFITLKDGRPNWVHDLVMDAHGDFLPEDWRYGAIRDALGFIEDAGAETGDDLDDSMSEFADSNVDTYNADRFRWLASHLSRAGYVDEAVEAFGHSDQGITGDIGLGQYAELEEVFASVRSSLEARLEELEGR